MVSKGEEGWIKLERSITESLLWQEGQKYDYLRAWIDILLMVNYKPHPFALGDRVIIIEKNYVLTSKTKLAKRWMWSRPTVAKFLKLLRDSGKIEYEPMANGILLRVAT